MGNVFTSLTGATAWVALVLQYGLTVTNRSDGIGPALATLRFFSFFTILSNLLVALVCTFALAPRPGRLGAFLTTPRARAATLLYIAVTGLVYATLLAGLWQPQGAQLVADVLLHNVVPLAYAGVWLAFQRHGRLVWGDALRFLAFPLAFLGWTILRGALMREYPYPFIDVASIGWAMAAKNAAGLALAFLLLGLLIVAVDRWLGRRGSSAPPAA
jgi:hypothetical protein